MFISDIHISEAGLLTVTNVNITSDLKVAKVYVSFLGNKRTVDELLQILIGKRKLIRYYVGLQVELKYIPELRFYHDDTMKNAEKIDKLINIINQDD